MYMDNGYGMQRLMDQLLTLSAITNSSNRQINRLYVQKKNMIDRQKGR